MTGNIARLLAIALGAVLLIAASNRTNSSSVMVESANRFLSALMEGHHISQNYTLVGSRIVDGPSFFGANPAEVPTSNSRKAGGLNRGDPRCDRIQSPSFLIEYDNTQNGANHIHNLRLCL